MKALILTVLVLSSIPSFAQYEDQMGDRKLNSAEVPKSFPATPDSLKNHNYEQLDSADVPKSFPSKPDSLINFNYKLDTESLNPKTDMSFVLTNKLAIRKEEVILNN